MINLRVTGKPIKAIITHSNLSKLFSITILFTSIFLLTSCETKMLYVEQLPEKTEAHEFVLDTHYFHENKSQIIEEIYQLIKQKHPVTAKDFPQIKVTDVITKCKSGVNNCIWARSYSDRTEHRKEISTHLKEILEGVSLKFSSETHSTEVWNVTVYMSEIFDVSDRSTLEKSASFLYGLVCIGATLGIICPVEVTQYLKMSASISMNSSNKNIEVIGYGGSSHQAVSPKAMDDRLTRFKLDSKAFISAIASVTTGIVKIYEQKISSHGRVPSNLK